MPGGKLHWPIWVPYAIQAELDYTYGTKAWVAGDGWNAAQSAVNAVESAAYLWYLAIWWREAGKDGRREVKGTMAGWLATVGFATATVTVGKTVLYCKCSILLFSLYFLFRSHCGLLGLIEGRRDGMR